jgi:hypothetical protein
MLLKPTFWEQFSPDYGAPNKQFDWSAIKKKWVRPLLVYWHELMLLSATGEAAIAGDCT